MVTGSLPLLGLHSNPPDTPCMDSPARRAANRRNAQLSTGPRTDAGKAVSARNATKHGLLARQVVLPDESATEFDSLRDRLMSDLAPRGELESVLAERIVLAAWRLRRVVRLEATVIRSQQKQMESFPDVTSMIRAAQESRNRPPAESEPSLEETVHTAMVRDANGTGQLERLRRYEVTLEKSLLSSVHELERLQRRRGGELTPAPAVIDLNINKSDD